MSFYSLDYPYHSVNINADNGFRRSEVEGPTEPIVFPNKKDNKIVSTISNKKLYIGVGTKFVGTVKIYNNFITKFFARIFGWSMEVSFGDKIDREVRCIDKEDYKKFIEVFSKKYWDGYIDEDLNKYKEISCLTDRIKKEIDGEYMRDVINPKDRDKKTRELENAIKERNEWKAEALIRTGAAVHKAFIARLGNLGNQHSSYNADLKLVPHQFYVIQGPPVMHAKLIDSERIFNLLREFGAPTKHIAGEQFLYIREFEEASNNSNFNMAPNIQNGLPGFTLDASRGMSKRFRDRKENVYNLSFNDQDELVKEKKPIDKPDSEPSNPAS